MKEDFLDTPRGREAVELWTVAQSGREEDLQRVLDAYPLIIEPRGRKDHTHLGIAIKAVMEYRPEPKGPADGDWFMGLCEFMLSRGYVGSWRDVDEFVPVVSLALYAKYPDSGFAPMLYQDRYYLLGQVAEGLGLALPPIPPQHKMPERAQLYPTLCRCINDYGEEHRLSRVQLAALIHNYPLPVFLGDNEMPAPANVWLAMGNDGEYQRIMQREQATWPANKDARRGDLIVVYARSPQAYLHSVWQVEDKAFPNPFNRYYFRVDSRRVAVTPPVSIRMLQADPVLGQLNVVRRNLQGMNGERLPRPAFDALLAIWRSRGYDSPHYNPLK
ncbi:MAG: hypothetical protein LIP03_15455 [Bacteroidales bacterium]|nr:hypothetical protein [Bacteroidales bacterium]